MLRSLHIRNYVLIDSLDIDFPEGLIIITGQTGAGKSILLGALSLLTGAKADATAISNGADSCVVEAEFDIDDESGEIQSMLEENEVEWDQGHLLIRRVVHATGRSRSFVNDCPVSVQILNALSSYLIDIHSQHQALVLANRNYQLALLDHYAGNSQLLSQCSAAWKKLNGIKSELSSARERLSSLSAEKEYNEAQFKQLDDAKLQPGEIEALEEEQKQLANAEEIKSSLVQAVGCLAGDDSDMRPGVDSSLREARRQLEYAARYIPAMSAVVDRLESARIELDDILSEVEDKESGIMLSEERLQQVEDRMSMIYGLFAKHSCTTVEELIEIRERYGEALYDSSALEDKIQELSVQLNAAEKEYRKLSESLHGARVGAAGAFSVEIQGSLRFLELDRAEFVTDVNPSSDGPSGSDMVMFRFSNNGTAPVDVAKCASGGELSRIMLCLKAMMARYTGMPTMIFDEIDTGVSGSAADKMGSMICKMGSCMQVFSITHLPQVAAKGEAHYTVTKSESADGRTVSHINAIDGEDRVMEIARLLSGSRVSDAAIANARDLLGQV